MKLPECEVCGKIRDTKGSIISEIYYRHICYRCYNWLMESQSPSSGQAAYNRDRDFEDHEADIRQPFTDGKPDSEFIRLYPDKARQMFTDDEIAAAERA